MINYYPNKLCKCGCNASILILPGHRYKGVPDYLPGHQNRGSDHPNYGKLNSIITRSRISVSNTGRVVSVRTRRKLSEAGRNRRHSPETIEKIRSSSVTCHRNFKNTSIERLLQAGLITSEVLFTTHAKLLGHPDIFIEPNICVFADGDYWHGPKRRKQQARDKYVNEQLTLQGYRVLRFWQHEINTDLQNCLKTILSVMQQS